MSVKYQTTLLLSSDSTNDDVIVTDNGSVFQISLDSELRLPETAMVCTVKVDSATIWYNTPNIEAGVNDKMFIDDNGTPYVITIPTGLYGITELNDEIDRQVINLGGTSGLISMVGNNSTQKTVIQFNVVGTQIDFTQAQTFREILGFNSRLSPLAPSAVLNETDTGDNIAAFNQVEYYLIHSDVVSNGFTLNNYSSDIIAQVLIDTTPGKQIVYNPQNPDTITTNELIKVPRRNLTFRLTDQLNRAVNTLGELWSVKLIINYEVPIL